MKTLKKHFMALLGMKRELAVTAEDVAVFDLVLGTLPVGKLSVKKGVWHFEYSDEFKQTPKLRPLVEFPDLEKIYEQPELWQFFISRIPSTLQPDVERVLEEEHIDDDDLVALLRRFGRKTVTSPFELSYKELAA